MCGPDDAAAALHVFKPVLCCAAFVQCHADCQMQRTFCVLLENLVCRAYGCEICIGSVLAAAAIYIFRVDRVAPKVRLVGCRFQTPAGACWPTAVPM